MPRCDQRRGDDAGAGAQFQDRAGLVDGSICARHGPAERAARRRDGADILRLRDEAAEETQIVEHEGPGAKRWTVAHGASI